MSNQLKATCDNFNENKSRFALTLKKRPTLALHTVSPLKTANIAEKMTMASNGAPGLGGGACSDIGQGAG